jgi:hypothetical protein
MPAGVAAYIPLANITLGSSQASVTFSSISSLYRDLVLIGVCSTTSSNFIKMSINGTTSSTSLEFRAQRGVGFGPIETTNSRLSESAPNGLFALEINLMQASSTAINKTAIVKIRQGDRMAQLGSYNQATTAAVSSFAVFPETGSWNSGSSFALYGILAE